MTVLIDVLAVVIGWTAVGGLLLFVLEPRLMRETVRGVGSILGWPVVLYHQVPTRRHLRRESRRFAALRGHNDVVEAVMSVLRDVPETALLVPPLRARIAAAIDDALDAAIDSSSATGGTPRSEYTDAFLSACGVVDGVFQTAATAEAQGASVSMPFVGDLVRALLAPSRLTGRIEQRAR